MPRRRWTADGGDLLIGSQAVNGRGLNVGAGGAVWWRIHGLFAAEAWCRGQHMEWPRTFKTQDEAKQVVEGWLEEHGQRKRGS